MSPAPTSAPSVVIVGAGPAGLCAAAELTEANLGVTVLERDPEYVGGIARTVRYKGWRFDIGGHRFFSKNEEVTRWWRERLPGEFISVPRLSRIFYRGKFFAYPLKAKNALLGLGFFTCVACVLSYFWRKMFPIKPEKSFRDWVTNRFGDRLFSIFFKTYTEKVWGHALRADLRRLGRAAHQGPLAHHRHLECPRAAEEEARPSAREDSYR